MKARVLPVLALSAACSAWDAPVEDARAPAGPCWEVNLGDGLDEASTDEVHALVGCLNQAGTFDSLLGVDTALDAPTRAAVPVGIELAVLVNGLPQIEVDPWSLAEAALALLDSEEPVIEPLAEVGVELAYGRPYGTVQAGLDLAAEAELDQGLLRPGLPVLARGAGAVLDEGAVLPELLADAATSPVLADGLCTLAGVADSDDPEVRSIADDLMPHLGQALALAEDSSNDRWLEAEGSSLGTLVDAVRTGTDAEGRDFRERAAEPLALILGDTVLRSRLIEALDEAAAGGHLDPLPLQLRHLALVPPDDGEREREVGEDAALHALLRMLHDADQPLDCDFSRIDLGFFEIDLDLFGWDPLEVHIDNLAEWILRLFAGLDPDTAELSVSLIGTLLDLDLGVLDASDVTEIVLGLAEWGECTVIDAQLAEDLQSVNRLDDEAVGDLLVVMLGMLDAFEDADEGQDRIPELVDLLAAATATGLVEPLQEVLIDLGNAPIAADLTRTVPVVLHPEVLAVDSCPTGASPLTLPTLWGLAEATLVGSEGSPAHLDTLAPLLVALADHPQMPVVIDNLGQLLRADGARSRSLPVLLTRLVAVDPELALLADNAHLLREPSLVEPLLRAVETSAMSDAMAAPTTPAGAPGPLPFVARLVLEGVLEDLLRTVDVVLDGLALGTSEETQ